MKPTKCPAKGKKMRQEKQRLLCPNAFSKFCFLCMPEIHKLIFCTWIRRPRSVRPVNSFMVSFSSKAWQWPENRSTSIKTCFAAKFLGAKGLMKCLQEIFPWVVSFINQYLLEALRKSIIYLFPTRHKMWQRNLSPPEKRFLKWMMLHSPHPFRNLFLLFSYYFCVFWLVYNTRKWYK